MATTIYLLAAILVVYLPASTHAHGRMLEPPSRMSAYLAGFSTPVNYNDHEMNCGGRVVQWDQNGGKCGICGDPWSGPRRYERPNGAMVQHNVITEVYQENEVIKIEIQITKNHKGWMEFRVCDIAKSGGVEATHECLDQNLLADELGQTRFYLQTTNEGMFEYIVVLPEGLTCRHCLLQWRWKAGNDWGCGANGCCTGCGERQEEFYACADITIEPRNGRFDTTVAPPRTTRRTTTTTTRRTTTTTTTTRRPTTDRPTTRPPMYTQRPTTRAPVYTYRPTTRNPNTPTPKPNPLAGYKSVHDYLMKNKPKSNHGTNLVYSNHVKKPINNRDDFLFMVLGNPNRYAVDHGRIVTPQYHRGVPITVQIDQNTRNRVCATCMYGCRYSACYQECPQICRGTSTRTG